MKNISKGIFDFLWVRCFRRSTFVYAGKDHYYCNSLRAFNTERSVEIPIATQWLIPMLHTLELGDVISGYMGIHRHVIVDKYERRSGVIGVDLMDFRPGVRFRQIISISTLEHIGKDEEDRRSGKLLDAFHRLHNLLESGGRMLITIPIGYNHEADNLIEDVKGSCRFMVRVNRKNEWQEQSFQCAFQHKYGSPYRFANAVAFYER